MRKLFFPSCEARFLNKEKIVDALKKIAGRMAEKPNVRGVYLFGSLVEGVYTPKSDADILVVLKADERNPRDRIPEYLRYFLDAPIPVDVFPFTEKEIAKNPFLSGAIRKGINLLKCDDT